MHFHVSTHDLNTKVETVFSLRRGDEAHWKWLPPIIASCWVQLDATFANLI